ncbi:MAG: DUF4252 domain-containing protein [Pseudomonadota bacterium]
MKRMKIRHFFLAVPLWMGLMSGSVLAQSSSFSHLPGYVNLGDLTEAYGEPKVMVNLSRSLLRLMGAFSGDDPVARELLRELEGVHINVYDTGGEMEPAMAHLDEVKSSLVASGWEPIVQVREDGERMMVYIRLAYTERSGGEIEESVEGLTVVGLSDDEAVFINIVGNIRPDRLGDVMEQFDMDMGFEGDRRERRNRRENRQ